MKKKKHNTVAFGVPGPQYPISDIHICEHENMSSKKKKKREYANDEWNYLPVHQLTAWFFYIVVVGTVTISLPLSLSLTHSYSHSDFFDFFRITVVHLYYSIWFFFAVSFTCVLFHSYYFFHLYKFEHFSFCALCIPYSHPHAHTHK